MAISAGRAITANTSVLTARAIRTVTAAHMATAETATTVGSVLFLWCYNKL